MSFAGSWTIGITSPVLSGIFCSPHGLIDCIGDLINLVALLFIISYNLPIIVVLVPYQRRQLWYPWT
ncbi:Hypothetical Protein FCC1311_083132 [Hondaea fermentalgiana]|uniref:Uncharacterized protein n=1 Tax=Hondaea fermentalgiana TaxID=2315210 RepID=A0A2R5GQQ2_9STRA|nr:Hypothetical Protein FCC1311_083132 [Hondaea fermentalgiana]|eukprot:GBG32088.1 Hypothetical Protein FCC1311_083132 [Hondaea fermentalgiana]